MNLDAAIPYLPFVAIAAIVTAVATPVAMAAARRWDVMDHPDTFLKPHAKSTPYLGGAALVFGWCIALMAATLFGRITMFDLSPMLLGGLAIAIIGLADDIRHIEPKLRLGLCSFAALVVMWSSGFGPSLFSNILASFDVPLPPLLLTLSSYSFSLFIILGACNSANLIDGIDGLCAGVMAFIGLGFFALTFVVAEPATSSHLVVQRLAAIALLGAGAGFLVWNFKPAKIFMGDAGSLFLGFVCGMLILSFAHAGLPALLAAITLYAVPIFDSALAMYRRWNSGKPIFIGDRSHFYDQLVQRGFSVPTTCLICYACVLVTIAAAIGLAQLAPLAALIAFTAFWLAVFVVSFLGGFTHPPAVAAAPAEEQI